MKARQEGHQETWRLRRRKDLDLPPRRPIHPTTMVVVTERLGGTTREDKVGGCPPLIRESESWKKSEEGEKGSEGRWKRIRGEGWNPPEGKEKKSRDSTKSKRTLGTVARGPQRIKRGLMAGEGMITAPDRPGMRQATVAVRRQVAALTEVVEEVEVVVATADVTWSRGEDMKEIMTAEVEVAGGTTGRTEEGEEEEEDKKEVVEEGMEAVTHGQAQATAQLLQS